MSINDDLLPEMVMPEPKPELSVPNIVATIEDPDFPNNEDIPDGDVNDIEDEDDEELPPEPRKRVIIPKSEIFKTAPIDEGPKVQKVKQKRKPRGPASEKQLESLARARAKGAETRRKKAEEKKQIKEMEKQLKQQEIDEKKESLQRRLKKTRQVREETDDEMTDSPNEESYNSPTKEIRQPSPARVKTPVNKKVVEDTIEKAVSKGIAEYEMKRKERKREKQERIAKEQHDKKILNTVHKAIDPDAYWEQCFR